MSRPVDLSEACRLVAAGKVVVYPTETLWGIGGDARLPQVADRVRQAKRVQGPHPFLVLAASPQAMFQVVRHDLPHLRDLAFRFWPGPLTLVVPVTDPELAATVGRTGTVGFRISPHPAASSLARAARGFLLSTSANLSGEPPPASLAQVSPLLLAAVDAYVDDPSCGLGTASTVLAWSPAGWKVLREGALPAAEILALTSRK